MDITYSNDGNITSKTDVGEIFNYGEGSDGPHALTSIEKVVSAYDPPPQNITYTNFNKVSTIQDTIGQDTTLTLAFTYGLNNQRVKTVLSRNATVERIKYFNGDYEEDSTASGTKKYHYISAPNGLTAIFVKEGSADTLYHVLKDHLGSLNGVINAETDDVTYYSYNAWGVPRDPDDWISEYTGELFAGRGYTGHEHLMEFSLINMNGRVYDPVLARFLSPDPFVQFSGVADGYNRYSYVMNNPLKFTDPSGYLSEYYRQKNIQNQYDGGYYYSRGEFYVWDKRSQTFTTYGNSFDTGPTGSAGAVNGYNWQTGEYQEGGETVPYYYFFAERGIGGNMSAIAAAGGERKFAGSINWIQYGENYVKPIWEFLFWDDGEVIINPAFAANGGGVPERNPLISNPYGWEGYNSLQNMRMRIENLDENLKYGKPESERRKTGQPPKLIKAIVSPIVALPNAVVTVFNGEDMYGNEVSSAQRWIGAPISATLFLFPTQITSYLDIPEVSVYIIDPLINKSLE